jgi:hypothetical protein
MAYNPIISVTPVDFSGTPTGAAVTSMLCPSVYDYNLEDISAPDAGRNEAMVMNKMRIGQAVTLDLEWEKATLSQGSVILQAFNSQYLSVEYIDGKAGTTQTKRFYVGARKAAKYNSHLGYWNTMGFTLIQQVPDVG